MRIFKFQRNHKPFIKIVLSTFILTFILFPFKVYASCRDPKLLLPEVQTLLSKLQTKAKLHGIEFIVTCTYRSQKDQNALYAKGRTVPGRKVTWTRHSAHTTKRAFDVAIVKEGAISWVCEDYTVLGHFGKELGLIWGGSWKVRDCCHFELPLSSIKRETK